MQPRLSLRRTRSAGADTCLFEEPMMYRRFVKPVAASLLAIAPLVAGACSADGKTKDQSANAPQAVTATPVAAIEQPIARFIRASGTLMAEEQADVAAETAGRVVAASIERGTAVT